MRRMAGSSFFALFVTALLPGLFSASSWADDAKPDAAAAGASIRVLIVDGQNNHNWKATTPILKAALKDAKLFTVDVATAPGGKLDKDEDFKPDFSKYQVVVSNYNGASGRSRRARRSRSS